MTQLPQLPVLETLEPLKAALGNKTVAVLAAPPGSGKTTVVPLALLDEPWLAGRKILILEPRRLAARAAARRMASLLQENVGDRVGYQIRFERRISAATRIEVITEGLLTRRLQSDPELPGVGLVIFDEFHERSLDADLALALTLDARANLNPDLRVLVMSATLDTQAVSRLLGDAPVIESSGQLHPVDIHYQPPKTQDSLEAAVAKGVLTALSESQGDILTFLPGGREIRATQRQLASRVAVNVDLMPLYGDLDSAAQDAVLRPAAPGRKKVILATNIAQTSLTIEGITTVVDSGYARVARFDRGSGANRLETRRISRAAADQRAGRAGRLGPGACHRMWSRDQYGQMPAQDRPEILMADLSRLVLELAAWGVTDPARVAWLDPPTGTAWQSARALLQELDALDDQGRVTAHGRELQRLPVPPRRGHMLLMARQHGLAGQAAWVAALLEERDGRFDSADLGERLAGLNSGAGFEQGAKRRIEDTVRQLLRLLDVKSTPSLALPRQGGGDSRESPRQGGGDSRESPRQGGGNSRESPRQGGGNLKKKSPLPSREGVRGRGSDTSIGRIIAWAYPERLARRRPGQAPGGKDVYYQCADGGEASLRAHDPLPNCEWLAIAHWDADTPRHIYLAAAMDQADVEQDHAAHIQWHEECHWDAQMKAVHAAAERRLGAIVLSQRKSTKQDKGAVRAAMLEGVRMLGLEALPWSDSTRGWQARVLSLRAWRPEENWPDVGDEALMKALSLWLAPWLDGISRREHLAQLDLAGILNNMLDYAQQQALARLAPTHLPVPSGSRIALQYAPPEAPVLAVKLQEMFGLSDTPTVNDGRTKVSLQLLSPARRPLQVTQDLAGFWQRTYPDVKKELKGRYPKHPWPDDPHSAVPTARAKRKNR